MIIFLWKISQQLVSGYDLSFTTKAARTGRKAVPPPVLSSAPTVVRNARAGTLAVKWSQLFNLMPLNLRNSDHGDILMFKNHLDIYLESIPDEPTGSGLIRGAVTNSLIHQIPLFENQATFY